jgi:hypothetical protein
LVPWGLSIGVPTSGLQLNSLANITGAEGFSADVNGISLAFEQPPMTLAGIFEHDFTTVGDKTEEVFKGGVAVSFRPYTLTAVGEYAIVTSRFGLKLALATANSDFTSKGEL